MRSRLRLPALVSSLALVTGCGTAERVEVHGVVLDGRTGRAVSGARVSGAGAATRTDADGRFRLYLPRNGAPEVRVSAVDHLDLVERLPAAESESVALELTMTPELVDADTADETGPIGPDAVIGWAIDDAGTADGVLASTRSCRSCQTVFAQPDGCDGCHAGPGAPDPFAIHSDDEVQLGGGVLTGLGRSAPCASCHREVGEAATPQLEFVMGAARPADPPIRAEDWAARVPSARSHDGIRIGPTDAVHAGLADGCLACHGRAESASSSCQRCHGDQVVVRDFDGDGRRDRLEAEYERAVVRAREALAQRLLAADERARLDDALEAVVRDGSRGAHNPTLTFELLAEPVRRIRRAASPVAASPVH